MPAPDGFPRHLFATGFPRQLTFTTIFIIWTVSLVFRNVIDILRAWIEANLEQRILSSLRQHVYDHIQSAVTRFLHGRTNRGVDAESSVRDRNGATTADTGPVNTRSRRAGNDNRDRLPAGAELANDPGAFCSSLPLTLLMFQYTSGKLQQGAMGINMSSRELGAELEETISGISDIQVFNAQKKRSDRFREASKSAAKSTASTTAWMSLSNSGVAGLYFADHRHGDAGRNSFGPEVGSDFSSAIVFMQMAPNLFTPVQRLVGSYTMYQSLVPGIVSTYELIDTKPSVVENPTRRTSAKFTATSSSITWSLATRPPRQS